MYGKSCQDWRWWPKTGGFRPKREGWKWNLRIGRGSQVPLEGNSKCIFINISIFFVIKLSRAKKLKPKINKSGSTVTELIQYTMVYMGCLIQFSGRLMTAISHDYTMPQTTPTATRELRDYPGKGKPSVWRLNSV